MRLAVLICSVGNQYLETWNEFAFVCPLVTDCLKLFWTVSCVIGLSGIGGMEIGILHANDQRRCILLAVYGLQLVGEDMKG